MGLFLLQNTKVWKSSIQWKSVGFSIALYFYCKGKTVFLQNIFFCVPLFWSLESKFWNNMMVRKLWQTLHFGWSIPLSHSSNLYTAQWSSRTTVPHKHAHLAHHICVAADERDLFNHNPLDDKTLCYRSQQQALKPDHLNSIAKFIAFPHSKMCSFSFNKVST